MTSLADTLPDDPATLKAMVLAERERADRLAPIIREMQRHRFGRRAETLPLDQMELGLEEVQQEEAAEAAREEKADPAKRAAAAAKRRTNRGALPAHLPRIETISQKTKLAEAIRYALSRWAGLSLFLDDGHIELDNNTVERAIRPLALNRKNALFAGSDEGAEHWAILASLIETAKLNDIDPEAYLADVITRIVGGHPQSQIGALMPWAYAEHATDLA